MSRENTLLLQDNARGDFTKSYMKECDNLKAEIKQLHQDMTTIEMTCVSQLANQYKIYNDNIVSNNLIFSCIMKRVSRNHSSVCQHHISEVTGY